VWKLDSGAHLGTTSICPQQIGRRFVCSSKTARLVVAWPRTRYVSSRCRTAEGRPDFAFNLDRERHFRTLSGRDGSLNVSVPLPARPPMPTGPQIRISNASLLKPPNALADRARIGGAFERWAMAVRLITVALASTGRAAVVTFFDLGLCRCGRAASETRRTDTMFSEPY